MNNQTSIFQEDVRNHLISRISNLKKDYSPQWGKMNIEQMINHCILWDEMALGKMNLKQVFLGLLFGKVALRSLTKDDNPFPKNMSTIPELHNSTTIRSFERMKENWIAQIYEYGKIEDDHIFLHSFFGRVNKHKTGILAFKHTDHHLRQFGA